MSGVGDATGYSDAAFYLAYLHPVWMLCAIALALAALRSGLSLRRGRLGERSASPAERGRLRGLHLRFAKFALPALYLGALFGLCSAVWLRGWSPLASAHGMLGMLTLALFTGAAVFGRSLEAGERRFASRHGMLGLAGTLATALTFGSGFVLLP